MRWVRSEDFRGAARFSAEMGAGSLALREAGLTFEANEGKEGGTES